MPFINIPTPTLSTVQLQFTIAGLELKQEKRKHMCITCIIPRTELILQFAFCVNTDLCRARAVHHFQGLVFLHWLLLYNKYHLSFPFLYLFYHQDTPLAQFLNRTGTVQAKL